MNQESSLTIPSTEPLLWTSTENPIDRCLSWLQKEKISFQFNGKDIFTIADKAYFFYPEYVLLTKDEETQKYIFDCEKQETDFLFFFFGDKLYYSGWSEVQLNEAECLGEPISQSGTFLGLHGKNEVLRGLSPYDRWIKRLKFYGYNNIGLCERNTLAGTLEFQNSCKKNGVNFIFGYELEFEGQTIKLYVKDEKGWDNLLTIHYHNNVTKQLTREVLQKHKTGLICVISKTFTAWAGELEDFLFRTFFNNIYFQFSFREYKTRSIDDMYMHNLSVYLDTGGPEFIPPVMIDDCYYPKASDYEAWCLLLAQSHNFFNQSDDLFIKTNEEIIEQFKSLNPTQWYEKVLNDAIENRKHFVSFFEIKSTGPKMPTYIPSKDELYLGNNRDIFYYYVYSGFGKIKEKNLDEYEERLNYELDVMEKGNLIDYFLILKDCYNYADKVGIRYNFGRGSAAGSLALYCMGLTKIDPLKEKLIFERFLNSSRLLNSLPDIDSDIESARRDEIKQYLISKYGQLHTCYIGAKTEYKIKSSIGDIAKFIGLSNTTKNLITENLPSGEHEVKNITKLAHFCIDRGVTREWVEKYPKLFELISPIVETVRSNSVHAAGVVVFPGDKPNYLYCPMKMKDGVMISEWDGSELDKMGFLKNDILSIDQLDKIGNMIKLIGKDIDIYNIPTDDAKTLDLFNKGLTQDVFQFNSSGMTELLKMIGIQSIKDLDAAVALYRPGAMGTGGHTAYANRKNGREEFSFIRGTENQTRETYGVMLYQEQLIFIAQEVAGFNLVDSDIVRSSIGKKDLVKMQSMYPKFIEGGIANGYTKEELDTIWQVFIDSSSYSFNKCISGDESIYRISNGNRYAPNIREMYLIKNDPAYAKRHKKIPLRSKYNNRKNLFGTSLSMNNENRLTKNKVIDIRYEGIKPVFRMILEDGRKIDVTSNHKFPTSNGIKELSNIDISSDMIYVNAGYEIYKWDFRFTAPEEMSVNARPGHCGFHTKDTAYTKYEKFTEVHSKSIPNCEICGIDFKEVKNNRREVHYIDGDHGNSDYSNLTVVYASCHKKEHYKMGRVKWGEKGLLTRLVKISSIEYLKDIDVYDVEMAAPNHTFCNSEGVVTCNSHSVCYARLGYTSMWFKAHYPNEFFQTSLQFVETKSLKKEETKAAILKEMQYFGIQNNPVSINYSTADYSVKNGKLYASLTSVKQMGESAIKAIIDERDANGKFFSFEEFESRVKIPKNKLKNLIIAGAFDEFLKTPLLKYSVVKNLVTEKEAPIFEKNKMSKFFWSAKQMEVSGFTDFDFAADYGRGKRLRILGSGWETKTMMEKYFDIVGIITEVTKFKTGSIKLMIRNRNEDYPIIVSKKNHQWAIDQFLDMKGCPVCINCMMMRDEEKNKNSLLFIGETINVL